MRGNEALHQNGPGDLLLRGDATAGVIDDPAEAPSSLFRGAWPAPDAAAAARDGWAVRRLAPRQSLRGSPRLRRLLVGLDSAALVASWLPVALLEKGGLGRAGPRGLPALYTAVACATIAGLGTAKARRLYRARVASIRSQERALLVWVAATSALVGAIVLHALGARVDDVLVAADAGACLALLVVARSAYRSWLAAQRRKGRYVRRTLIVGANNEGRQWARLLRDHPNIGLQVTGVVDDEPGDLDDTGTSWLGPAHDAVAIAAATGSTGALVVSTAFSGPRLRQLLRDLMRAELHVQVSPGLLGLAHSRLTITPVSRENLFYLERRSLSWEALAAKRALDLVVASLVLVLSAPVVALAALAVRLEDGGSALFRQERVGRYGRHFVLYKIRTMTIGADERKAALAAENLREGPLFKVRDDPRVTRLGRFLRITSIDELPQLVNVLRGEMSLVGPRPALPDEVAAFDTELLERHDVLPGITGLWQVEGRDDGSFDSYQRLDLHYVENWSILLDLSILLSTAVSLVTRTLRAYLGLLNGRSVPS